MFWSPLYDVLLRMDETVALFEIENDTTVTIMAIQNKRESDYH
jgi:hypothetical protein